MKISLKILLLYSILIISSCEKGDDVAIYDSTVLDKSIIEKASQEQKEAYAKFHLLKIAKYLDMKLSNKKINEQILAKGFENGKTKTYYAKYIVESIIDDAKNTNSNDIEKSLNAFQNIEGENWQVTISIPNYKRVAQARELDETKPIFVLSVDTEKEVNSDQVDGYQLSSDNNMEKLDEKVNEEIALNNMVYKVGITIMPIDYESGGSSGGGSSGSDDGNLGGTNGTGAGQLVIPGGSSGTSLSAPGLTVKFVRAYLKKESWFEDNEVHFNGYTAPLVNNNSDNVSTQLLTASTQYDWDCNLVAKFDNYDVNDGISKFAIFVINSIAIGWNGGTNSYIFYVLFEHDNWPAPLKQENFHFTSGYSKHMYFRSYEGYYDKVILWNPHTYFENNPTAFPTTFNYQVNNSQIKYNLVRN